MRACGDVCCLSDVTHAEGRGKKNPSVRHTKGASKFDDARQTERLEAAAGSRCGVKPDVDLIRTGSREPLASFFEKRQ